MTAIAVAYVTAGFAVSAEGRQQWAHQPTRERSVRADERDDVQKIFEVAGERAVLAYTVSGDIASRDRSFDLTAEVGSQVALLRGGVFWSGHRFVEALSGNLEKVIETAKGERRIEDYPTSEVLLLGYVRRRPCFFSIQFHRVGAGMLRRVVTHELQPGCCLLIGSELIGRLILSGDARFMRFCRPLDAKSSLQNCVAFARGYVEACCCPLARELDPECRKIGGHIHVATLTPPDGSVLSRVRNWFGSSRQSVGGGFRWVQPPISL
jgi:hypothetical protein